MSDDPAIIAIAQAILRAKRMVVPQDSRRAKAFRWLMAPLLGWLRARAVSRGEEPPPPPGTVSLWESPALTARRDMPARPRLLVLAFGHLGDFVVTLPALDCLRKGFPDSDITLVCGPPYTAWVERLGWHLEVVPFNIFTAASADWTGMTEERLQAFTALDLGPFDLAVDLRHDVDTRVLLGLVEARFRAGYRTPPGKGPALDLALPRVDFPIEPGEPPSLHAELRLLLLAQAVVAVFGQMRPAHPIRGLLDPAAPRPARPYAVVCPGAGAETRVWPIARLVAVCQALVREHDLDIEVIGGPGEAALAAQLVAGLPEGRARNNIGTLPLARLPDLVAGASLFLGYDTGPTHLAAALGVPTVSVFAGVGEIEVWHPLGERVTVVAAREPCSPCGLIRDADCPIGVICRERIPVGMVLEACEAALKRKASPSLARLQDA